MKIAHECPLNVLEEVSAMTDYSYCLVHLLDEYPQYLDFFRREKEKGREIVIDNSVFETEKAYDSVKYLKWIQELQPTYYIIPDALESMRETLTLARDWYENYHSKAVGKAIGVVQGQSYSELTHCYRALDQDLGVDKIAISFNYDYYRELVPHPNEETSWMLGRIALLNKWLREGIINKKKPHHLLGASDPREFKFYNKEHFSWIDSLDTSSPVVLALTGKMYDNDILGWYKKPRVKLYTLLDDTSFNKELLIYNINIFRKYVNR